MGKDKGDKSGKRCKAAAGRARRNALAPSEGLLGELGGLRNVGLGIAAVVLVVWFLMRGGATPSSQTLRGEGEVRVRAETPPEGHQFYFAYASDLLEDRLRRGSSKTASRVGPAYLAGYVFEYTIFSKVWKGGVADLVEVDDPEEKAWGLVWAFPVADIANLDKQKGIDNADPKYAKVNIRVRSEDGRVYNAFTYTVLANKRRKDSSAEHGLKRFAPSQQYRKCVLRGAQSGALPHDYVARLEAIPDNGEAFRRKSVGSACD